MCSVAYKFGYQGSEKDDEIAGVTGAHYTTFFRELDTRIGRWWAVDPDGDQTPWQSPYCSMDNNPIWLNDPLGDSTNLDDYKLNKISGEITKIRETKDETDKLYAQDENGKLDTKNFITLSKGILDKQINAKPYNKTTSTYMVSSKSEELENLYNFVGTNSDVEWGFGKISNNVSILGTNHSSERVGVQIGRASCRERV